MEMVNLATMNFLVCFTVNRNKFPNQRINILLMHHNILKDHLIHNFLLKKINIPDKILVLKMKIIDHNNNKLMRFKKNNHIIKIQNTIISHNKPNNKTNQLIFKNNHKNNNSINNHLKSKQGLVKDKLKNYLYFLQKK